MSTSGLQAAHDLARVLSERATDLASDDLATISAAMAEVRAAARGLEGSLTDRGWGGGVLYGFGDTLDDDDDLDEELEDDPDDPDDPDEDNEDLDAEEGGDPPTGRRITYQGRYDFIVVDEDRFMEYVVQRASTADPSKDREYVAEHSPEYVLFAELLSVAEADLRGAGLKFSGGQDMIRTVPITLWEMESGASDDCFPTAT